MDEQIPLTVEDLNLKDNLIHTIANGTFAKKQFLHSLALDGNQLTSLEFAALIIDTLISGQPVKLSVADNPFHCNCNMDWIRNNNKNVSLFFSFLNHKNYIFLLTIFNCLN